MSYDAASSIFSHVDGKSFKGGKKPTLFDLESGRSWKMAIGNPQFATMVEPGILVLSRGH